MAIPAVLLITVFVFIPLLNGIRISLTDWDGFSQSSSFVGFSNYLNIFKDSRILHAIKNTFYVGIGDTLLQNVFGLMYALLLNRKFTGRTAVRTCFYIPYVTNMIAVGIVFKYLLNPSRGPVNAIFRLFGADGPGWLSSPVMALPTAAVIAGWAALAFNVITCLAALQDIPADMYEVADIEGAGFWQKIHYIVLPYLTPTLFMLLTITLINSFRNYTAIAGLTGGGPGTSSKVVSLLIYDDAFNFMKFSIASAEGVIFTLFIIIVNRLFTKARSVWESR